MNEKYSEKEIAAFDAKDRLHAMQTALNVAGINNMGLGKSSDDILAESKRYYNELLNAKNGINQAVSEGTQIAEMIASKLLPETIPVPTLEQKTIFEQIAKETGLSFEDVVHKIYLKKHSLVIENVPKAIEYLKSLKGT